MNKKGCLVASYIFRAPNIADPSNLFTSVTNGVIGDRPLEVTNSQGSEGRLRHSRHVGVGHILHGPGVLFEVVADDGLLYANV